LITETDINEKLSLIVELGSLSQKAIELIVAGHRSVDEIRVLLDALRAFKRKQLAAVVIDPKDPSIVELFQRPVSELNLSVRTTHSIEFTDIKTVGDLARSTEVWMSERKSRYVVRFQRKSINEIRDALEMLGLWIGMTDEEIANWTPPQTDSVDK